ncbi:MAG: YggS family pyridoxal phosphate-dependent enzyme [Synechococcales cyanobacterium CRU_2_2]|nr:YggS family pyridoxal phosphate-dependent enzyme [Synechococcales cyanobacterium CRU_2_2]
MSDPCSGDGLLAEDEQAAIAVRIQAIRQTLPNTVRLIAVSKTHSAAHVRAAYAAGIRDFGENRVQEAIEKQAQLQDLADVTWHLLGPLQSNKARKAVDHFDWIHSLDSLALAERLDRIAAEQQRSPQICLQVKLRHDPSKSGWSRDELFSQLPQLSKYKELRISGVMTIAPLGLETVETLRLFEEARDLAEQVHAEAKRQRWSNMLMNQLSMGMSEDYLLAVKAGSTLVRLGRTIFGSRG